MILVKLVMGDLSKSSIFHVINARTSYKLLLGRSWLHEHGIVTSTLHQCLKYYRGGERKINDSVKPLTRVEPHFAGARFLEEDDTPKETMPGVPYCQECRTVKCYFHCGSYLYHVKARPFSPC